MAKCLYRTRSKGRERRKSATYRTPAPGASSQDWTVWLRVHGGLMRPAFERQRLQTGIDANQPAAGTDSPARITREASGTFR